MNLKFVKNNETLLEKEMVENLSKEDEKQILQFGSHEAVSFLLEFNEGVILDTVKDMSEIEPKDLKQITITVK